MKKVVRKILSIVVATSVVMTCAATTAFAQKSTASAVGVSYSAHVQDIGWQSAVADGATVGTTGQSKRVEALTINLTNAPAGASIAYQVHVQDYGWISPASKDGAIAGTVGQSKRVEAIAIALKGMPGYSVQYRVHVQDIGWQPWTQDGSIAGTIGRSLRMEAIEIRIVAPVSAITVTPTAMTLTAGGATGTITATVEPSNASNKNVTWSSSNTAVATVAGGVVTPIAAGTVTITATTADGGKTATCAVTVTSGGSPIVATPVSAITVTGDAVVGATLTAAPTPGAATGTYQWTICNTIGGIYTNIDGETASTYTLVAGDATKFIKVTFTASGSYTGTQTSAATAVVSNATQLAPTGLLGVAPTTYDGTNGTITSTTTLMEYKLSGGASYTTVTATTITGLAAGTYNVRYAAKAGFDAGTDAVVVVAAGPNAAQLAPTGLLGVAPTSVLNDGKITGTTNLMEYKLASAADNTYLACAATETTVPEAGNYVVRLAAKTGFNASPTAAVTVAAYVAPTEVSSAAELNAVRNNLDGNYIQTANIDLSGYSNWVSIGTVGSPFKGNYNGNGYSISNLVINNVSNGYMGLFGSSLNANFQNIVLKNINVSGWSNIGGLIGYNEGSDITNCSIGGIVTGSGYRIGGLVGFSKDSVIKNSNATCNVTAVNGDTAGGLIGILYGSSSIIDSYATGNIIGLSNIGGLVGQIYNENITNITECYSTGPVTASGTNEYYAGGLIGLANGGTVISSSYATGNVYGNNGVGGLVGQATKIVNCYSLGNVTGSGLRIGGLAGQNGGIIENCFSAGPVMAPNANAYWGGGLIGYYDSSYGILNSYYDTETSGFSSNDKGFARTTLQMKNGTENCQLDANGIVSVTGDYIYTGWDYSIWHFGTDSEYPTFN